MGADLIGWRDCELQKPLGESGFLQKLKMKSYLRVIESQVPEGARENVAITVIVNDTQRELRYPQILEQAETFQRGIPACATCPLSGGEQLGCYHYVGYPVDARFEEVAFEFFTSQLATKDSISDQLYRDVVSKQPSSGTGWHTRRGEQGALARRPQPLTYSWGGLFSKKKVDSAQLLQSLFIPLRHPALVVGYARFWRELVAFADAKLAAEMKARGISLQPDGRINLQVDEGQVGNLAQKLGSDAAAMSALLEGTFGQIRRIAVMMTVLAPKAIDGGWGVVVDG
jgi:hypothetical protein